MSHRTPTTLIPGAKHLPGLASQYVRSRTFRRIAHYTRHLSAPVDTRVILYEDVDESIGGGDLEALFHEIDAREEFADHRHVWVVGRTGACPTWIRHHPKVEHVHRHGRRYVRHLATAGTLVSGSGEFPTYFVRRPEQQYINMGNGGLLRLPNGTTTAEVARCANVQRNLAHTTHLIVPNQGIADRILEFHDLDGLFPGKLIPAGAPRWDTMRSSDVGEIRGRLRIERRMKLLVFAPREMSGMAEVDRVRLIVEQARALRAGLPSEYAMRVHLGPRLRRWIAASSQKIPLVPEDLSAEEVVSAADVIVTGHPQLVVDGCVSRRPTIWFTGGEEDTCPPLFPERACADVAAVLNCVVGLSNQARFAEAVRSEWVGSYDTRAARHLVNSILAGDELPSTTPIDTRIRVLIYGGAWSNNGITSSAINLLNGIDPDRFLVSVVDEAEGHRHRDHNIGKVRRRIRRFRRVGSIDATFLESARLRACLSEPAQSFSTLPRSVYAREYRRMFGDIEFDVAIDFSGYVRLWALVIAFGAAKRRVIYQHNEMWPEREKVVQGRFKHRRSLDLIFRLYREFDRVVCVSRSAAEANRTTLDEFMESASLVVVENALDPEALRERATEPVGVVPPREPGEFAFVMLGRLSPEKGHEKLFRAFAEVRNSAPQAKLFVAGDGPLREELRALLARLDLEASVDILGQVANPYSLLRRSDCLVLSSDHEGQPMVLLEALALGVPIVATDIPGNRGILSGTSAKLVENSVEGLCRGMLDAIRGEVRASAFDAEGYRTVAIERFYREVLGVSPPKERTQSMAAFAY